MTQEGVGFIYYLLLPVWSVVYYCAEVWLFRFPKLFGGFENLEPTAICAYLLSRPQHEFVGNDGQRMCSSVLDDKVTSYTYVAFGVLCGLSFYQFLVGLRLLAIDLFSRFLLRRARPPAPQRIEGMTPQQFGKVVNDKMKNLLLLILNTVDEGRNSHESYQAIVRIINLAHPYLRHKFPNSQALAVKPQTNVPLVQAIGLHNDEQKLD